MSAWTRTGALCGQFYTWLGCSVKHHPRVFTLATAVVQRQEVSKPGAASQAQNRKKSRMSSSLLQEEKKRGKFQYLFCQNRRDRDPVQRENNLGWRVPFRDATLQPGDIGWWNSACDVVKKQEIY